MESSTPLKCRRSEENTAAINCNSYSIQPYTIDPRTNEPVRFFKFPKNDPQRHAIWVRNVHRSDLSVNNSKSKYVCSLHFVNNQFNNKDDISRCHLLPTAIPTEIKCNNPPPSAVSKRPPPKLRQCDPLAAKSKKISSSDVSIGSPPKLSKCEPPVTYSYTYTSEEVGMCEEVEICPH